MTLGPEQVHVAFQGYERERIYEPAIDSAADIVVLITHSATETPDSPNEDGSDDDDPEEGISKARSCRDEVRRRLEEESIDVQITDCNFFDLNDAVLGVGDVITRYQSDSRDIFLNIATGSKITAIAGTIAATTTDAIPYYVPAGTYYGKQISADIGDPQELPQYPFDSPHSDFLEVLQFIERNSDSEGYVIKKELVEFSSKLDILSEYNRKNTRHYYDIVDEKVIDPLLDWGYVKEHPRGDETRYTLTSEGDDILDVLLFMTQ